MLIDVAIPAGRNVVQKEAQNKLKYNSLCTEIQRMWDMQCVIVPVICGATGTVTKGLKNNLEATAGKHSVDSVQDSCSWNITRYGECCRLKLGA